jgi:hypothetical protein
MNLYYMAWIDDIKKMQSVAINRGQWKSQMMVYMSMAMALNIGVVMSILQLHVLGYVFYDIKFNIFPGEKLNNALSFFLLYLIVPVVLNYLLIYRNNKYEKLLLTYKYYNGKLVIIYFFGTLLITLIYGIFFTPTVN